VTRLKPKRLRKALSTAVASIVVDQYVLSLYVAGASIRSRQAILRAHELATGVLKGRCKLEVIDIYQDPARARDAQIIATPTLVMELPLPVRRLIGTLANPSRLRIGLGLGTPSTSVT
jgi:circadian clock protein KaiB